MHQSQRFIMRRRAKGVIPRGELGVTPGIPLGIGCMDCTPTGGFFQRFKDLIRIRLPKPQFPVGNGIVLIPPPGQRRRVL